MRELPQKLFDREREFALKLRNLDATNNKLREIPREIGNCVNITRLVLAANVIETLPDEIGALVKLKTLIVDGNRLRGEPRSFSSGALGWYLGGKVEVDVGGQTVWAQVGCNIVIPGSNAWKRAVPRVRCAAAGGPLL